MPEADFAHDGEAHHDEHDDHNDMAPPGAVADAINEPPDAPVGGVGNDGGVGNGAGNGGVGNDGAAGGGAQPGGDREAAPEAPGNQPAADPPPVVGDAWVDPPRDVAKPVTTTGGGDAVAGTVQPAKPAPAVEAGGRELPFTGAESIVLVACAFMLLASGAIFRLTARRRDGGPHRPGVDVQFAWRNSPHGPVGT